MFSVEKYQMKVELSISTLNCLPTAFLLKLFINPMKSENQFFCPEHRFSNTGSELLCKEMRSVVYRKITHVVSLTYCTNVTGRSFFREQRNLAKSLP